MEGLPFEVISLIREYLTPTFNSMLSLSCKRFFDEEGEHRIHAADATVSIPLIQYIYQGVPKKPSTFAHAAGNGNIDILCWLRENGAPWDRLACIEATRMGHLHVLQWLEKSGAPSDEWICMYAAERGHLHILCWIRENGAPWDKDLCIHLAKRWGHAHVLAWLEQQQQPILIPHRRLPPHILRRHRHHDPRHKI